MNRHQRRATAKQGKPVGTNAAQAKNHLGILLAQQGRLEEAVGLFREALRLEPKYAEAHNNLGLSLHQSERLGDAIPHYLQALALDPDYAEAHNNVGNALKDQGRLEDAVSHYRRAISLKPAYPEPHHNLGIALAELHKTDDAMLEYRTALSLRPDYVEAYTSLGLLLTEQGSRDEAAAAARQADALAGRPLSPQSHYMLGILLAQCGLKDAARQHLQRCLERDRGDRWGARMLLAGLGLEQLPARAPNALIDRVYARRAGTWDRSVAAGTMTYRGDLLVAEALAQQVGADAKLDILDAGCGTGLVGARIRHLAKRLDGVDLSAAMLAMAKEKGVYDALHQGDLMPFLAGRPGSYDAVTCAATLIHFGDMHPAFGAAAAALRDGGLFVFTLFPNGDDDSFAVHSTPGLAQGGCYAHGRRYVASAAASTGFSVAQLTDEIHEYYAGKPEMGLVAILRRR